MDASSISFMFKPENSFTVIIQQSNQTKKRTFFPTMGIADKSCEFPGAGY